MAPKWPGDEPVQSRDGSNSGAVTVRSRCGLCRFHATRTAAAGRNGHRRSESEKWPGDGALLFFEPVQSRAGWDDGPVTVRSCLDFVVFTQRQPASKPARANGHRRTASQK